MSKSQAIVGFYGKLPILGDFVVRRLPKDFIDPWDSWLQSAIATSREQLGSDWLGQYLNSPIWRFIISPGLCGNKAAAGIIMPSVDKVGRYYPLTVAVLFEKSYYLPYLLTVGNDWFELLEDAALSGLENNLDVQAFDRLIQSIPLFSLPDNPPKTAFASTKKAFYTTMTNPQQIKDAFVGLNASLLASFMPGYSMWSTAGSQQIEPALLMCEGLPAINNFTVFLNGSFADKTSQIQHHVAFFEPHKNHQNIMAQTSNNAASQIVETKHDTLSAIIGVDKPVTSMTSWQSWAITDTGKRRKHNEDSMLAKPESGLWAVADGMGGHEAGDVASQLIVSSLDNLSAVEPLEAYISNVESCLQNVNTKLRQLAHKKYGSHVVGSTVVTLVCTPSRCAFLWAGDSRLYRFRNNKLQQLTQDHCVDENQEEASAWSVKNVNIITRAVGADDSLDLDVEETNVINGDIFLLCSDGLDKEMSFNEIEHIMKTDEKQDIANTLMREALARGGRDNVTVIVIAVETIN